MQAIGAADLSAAAGHVATPATAGGVQLGGGASPAPAADPAVTTTGAQGAQGAQAADAVDPLVSGFGPIDVELTFPSIEEIATANAIKGRSKVPVTVEEKTPSVEQVVKTLDDPVVATSTRLKDRRDQLREALRQGKGDPKQVSRMLDDLDILIRMLERSEERKRLMKELLRKLMMGILTPQVIAMAKNLGLVDFLKDAIKTFVKRGLISPQAAKAMIPLLAAAGIRVPELDDMFVTDQVTKLRDLNAQRVARGQSLVDAGGAGLASADAAAGASALSNSFLRR